MPETILVTDDGPIRTIQINRPEKKNALTLAMYHALAEAIGGAATNDNIRCLIIAGHPTAFCAGNDIGEFVQMANGGSGLGEPILCFLRALVSNERPVVAAVAGPAAGIGTTMLMHCDYVVAADNATFSTPFAALGLTPEAASSLIAPRLMGHARAFELLVMGRPLSAEAAREAGLINTVVPLQELEAEASRAARSISALPREAVLTARQLMRGQPDELLQRIDEEAVLFRERLASTEAQAAFAAFLARKG
jgi:enoyl-CoA hydratase/carnithine racemase